MELLVLGANGLLGSNVVARASERGASVTAGYHSDAPMLDVPTVHLDITDTDRFESVCADLGPDAVINCAAMTDVDGCETTPERAAVVNGHAPGRIAASLPEDSSFVQVSTDYVFDGQTETRYEEGDEANPVQVYGETKLLGERLVSQKDPSALIPRLSFVYGRHGATGELQGFPAWVRDRLDREETVPAFVDQHVTPTRAGQAATVILDLLSTDSAGLFHVGAHTCTTPYGIAQKVAEIDDVPAELIEQGHMEELERSATRPSHTCFDVGLVESTLGYDQPAVAEDLRVVL